MDIFFGSGGAAGGNVAVIAPPITFGSGGGAGGGAAGVGND